MISWLVIGPHLGPMMTGRVPSGLIRIAYQCFICQAWCVMSKEVMYYEPK